VRMKGHSNAIRIIKNRLFFCLCSRVDFVVIKITTKRRNKCQEKKKMKEAGINKGRNELDNLIINELGEEPARQRIFHSLLSEELPKNLQNSVYPLIRRDCSSSISISNSTSSSGSGSVALRRCQEQQRN